MTYSAFRRSAVLSLAAAAMTATLSPAVAAKKGVVTVPATVLKDETSKLCMPRSASLTSAKDKSLPQTLCLTKADWATHGVTIVTK
ncbi:MAG TPA: hypothetical protein VM900_02550 [Sphingomonas sp.]|jgi:hypothetical protein|nr:hypothetical protein [Sphingomonas sp.]